MPTPLPQQWIVVLSTYPPRECGIATFAANLVKALKDQLPATIKVKVVAINRSAAHHYPYPVDVVDQVVEGDREDFLRVAAVLNADPRVKAVIVQHEFGIYGKHAGRVLVDFLRQLTKPAVTVMHTIEEHPRPLHKKVLQQVAQYSQAVITMNRTATQLLAKVYNITSPSIHVIPHGIPAVPPVSIHVAKKRVGLAGRQVLMTFGLLSRDKSIETVIRAMPRVVKRFPKVLYIVLGQTHPNVLVYEGESYRLSLEKLVTQLHLQEHVKFVNSYLSEQDVIQFLQATDLYMLSPKNPQQIVSGTLAYAMGAGRAVISTPFLHAKEMADRGFIRVGQFGSPRSFGDQMIELLSHPQLRETLERRSYASTRSALWKNVALNYHNILVALGAITQPHVHDSVKPEKLYSTLGQLPPLKSDHVRRLSDDFGVIQFSQYNVPDIASGYSTDDVARALIAMCMYWSVRHLQSTIRYITLYIRFLEFVTASNGKIYNMVSVKRQLDRKHWSQDAHARAVWSLGYVVATKDLPIALRTRAEKLLRKSARVTRQLQYTRSMSFSMLGYYYSGQKKLLAEKADFLVEKFNRNAKKDWQWFERMLTYSNSKLVEALLYAYAATKKKKYLMTALSSLEFLISHTIVNNTFHPIGQEGWFVRGGERSHFDQQPVEAASMVHTLMIAYRCTKQKRYLQLAFVVYQWFMGRNVLQQRVYDESTGGCFDGLGKKSLNVNQGAESTICHFMARMYFEKGVRIL